MSSKYICFFSGSFIEANFIESKLSENNIKYILRDDQKSANLAGFGIPNFLNSCKIFIKKKDIEIAKKLCKH